MKVEMKGLKSTEIQAMSHAGIRTSSPAEKARCGRPGLRPQPEKVTPGGSHPAGAGGALRCASGPVAWSRR
jgi:hypothetical protein